MATLKEKAEQILLEKQTKITPANIVDGVKIFDVEGTAEKLKASERTISPTVNEQTVYPEAGYNAISKMTIGAVTSDIDVNIIPDNIRKDVTILGVTGTHEGGSGVGIKEFESVALMEADTERNLGDKAIVVGNKMMPITEGLSNAPKLYYNKSITFQAGEYDKIYNESQEGNITMKYGQYSFDLRVRLSPSDFYFSGNVYDPETYDTIVMINMYYRTEDGLTFVNDDFYGSGSYGTLQPNGVTFSMQEWNDVLGKVFMADLKLSEGIYEVQNGTLIVPDCSLIPETMPSSNTNSTHYNFFNPVFMGQIKAVAGDTGDYSAIIAVEEYEDVSYFDISIKSPTKYKIIKNPNVTGSLSGLSWIKLSTDGKLIYSNWDSSYKNIIVDSYENGLLKSTTNISINPYEDGDPDGYSDLSLVGYYVAPVKQKYETTGSCSLLYKASVTRAIYIQSGDNIGTCPNWVPVSSSTIKGPSDLAEGVMGLTSNNIMVTGNGTIYNNTLTPAKYVQMQQELDYIYNKRYATITRDDVSNLMSDFYDYRSVYANVDENTTYIFVDTLAYKYDAKTVTLTRLADNPIAAPYYSSACHLNGKVYIAGNSNTSYQNVINCYDIATDSYSTITSDSFPAFGDCAETVAVGNKICILGETTSGIYNIDDGSFMPINKDFAVTYKSGVEKDGYVYWLDTAPYKIDPNTGTVTALATDGQKLGTFVIKLGDRIFASSQGLLSEVFIDGDTIARKALFNTPTTWMRTVLPNGDNHSFIVELDGSKWVDYNADSIISLPIPEQVKLLKAKVDANV